MVTLQEFPAKLNSLGE